MASIGQGDVRPGQAADFLGGRWSKLYPSEDQFRLANVPSGLAGATARGVVSLDNYPNTIAAIQVVMSYQIPAGFVATFPGAYLGFDAAAYDCTIMLSQAQQNINAGPIHLKTLQGWQNGSPPMPLTFPMYMRGTNQIRWEVVRLVDMPTVNEQVLIPTVHLTVKCVVTAADYAPGASPGSSGRP